MLNRLSRYREKANFKVFVKVGNASIISLKRTFSSVYFLVSSGLGGGMGVGGWGPEGRFPTDC